MEDPAVPAGEAAKPDEALWWEDFEPGRRWTTASRVVAEADIEAFADVSGDRNPLHLDDAYASASVFGGRVAHGMLGLSVATGLLNQRRLTAGTLVALLGVKWEFRKPLYPGTDVHLAVEVAERCATRKPDRGVVVLGAELRTTRGAAVQAGELALLVRRWPGPG